MLTIGDRFPEFKMLATVSDEHGKEFAEISDSTYSGKWKVYFFWPKDFTFVCPTEIADFGRLNDEFAERGAQVLGGSVDNEYAHLAWRTSHPDLKGLPFPMLSDKTRHLSASLGILDKNEGVSLRATFIVDPENTIQWVNVNNLDVGRNVPETLRVLDALQTGELTPCGWTPGQAVLKP